MDAAALRASFPVLERTAHLNAGTCGPVPEVARDALVDEARSALEDGRSTGYYERLAVATAELRSAYAALVGVPPARLALTTSTSEGLVRVLRGLALRPGDEVVTATREHPGLTGPLALLRRGGVAVRAVPLADVAEAVGPRTRLVACAHVSWSDGAVAPLGALRTLDGVPVLLDGAQGAGAVPVDLEGIDAYAFSGQKWLCGPVGLGGLALGEALAARLTPLGPTYPNLERPADALDAAPWPDARAHDAFALSTEAVSAALAAHDRLATFGWPAVHDRAAALAAQLADALHERGHDVASRGRTTLVSWSDPDPPTTKARLAQQDVVVRDLPGVPWLRASVGAWNDETDLERLLNALRP